MVTFVLQEFMNLLRNYLGDVASLVTLNIVVYNL